MAPNAQSGCERANLQYNLAKTNLSSSMGIPIIQARLRIYINGPPLSKFNAQAARIEWIKNGHQYAETITTNKLVIQRIKKDDILKITGFKVDTNEILLFFYFLFCLQNSKKNLWCHHIANKCFEGTLLGLLSCQKKLLGGIRSNCWQKLHFGSTRWIRPKVRTKRTLKILKIEKIKIQSPIVPTR